jgi:hypothetical protein
MGLDDCQKMLGVLGTSRIKKRARGNMMGKAEHTSIVTHMSNKEEPLPPPTMGKLEGHMHYSFMQPTNHSQETVCM